MNYKKHYQKLIETRKNLKRNKKNEFFEKHHIIPKCIGGSDKKENLILLTPKEHFIAHLLLTQMYTGKEKAKMCYAFFTMCMCNNNQNRKISAKQFELAKKLISENCSGKYAPFYGKKLSKLSKENIKKRMIGDNNPSRKYGVWNKGLKLPSQTQESNKKRSISLTGHKHSLETKIKMSKSAKGKAKSLEHKKKLSIANLGKKISKETRKKMSLARKGVIQRTTICPHCNIKGGIPALKRWHFDNCKMKII